MKFLIGLSNTIACAVVACLQALGPPTSWTPDVMHGDQVEVVSNHVYYGIEQHQLWKTTDSGRTWVTVFTAPTPRFSVETPGLSDTLTDRGEGSQSALLDLWFLDSTTGWVLSDEALHQTRDGGRTWTRVRLPNAIVCSCCFESVDHGWCAGQKNNPGRRAASWGNYHPVIYETVDGGRRWRLIFVGPGSKYPFNDLRLVGRGTLFAFGETIATSRDSGHSWSTLDRDHLLPLGDMLSLSRQIVFVNDRVGYILNNYDASHVETVDGGRTWHVDDKPVAPYGRWIRKKPSN